MRPGLYGAGRDLVASRWINCDAKCSWTSFLLRLGNKLEVFIPAVTWFATVWVWLWLVEWCWGIASPFEFKFSGEEWFVEVDNELLELNWDRNSWEEVLMRWVFAAGWVIGWVILTGNITGDNSTVLVTRKGVDSAKAPIVAGLIYDI